jgi:hypothetical protein
MINYEKQNKHSRSCAYFDCPTLAKALHEGFVLQSVRDPNTIILLAAKEQDSLMLCGIEISWVKENEFFMRIIKSVLYIDKGEEIEKAFEADKGRLYNILYCEELKLQLAYTELFKQTELSPDGKIETMNPRKVTKTVTILNSFDIINPFERTLMQSMAARVSATEERNSSTLKNTDTLQTIYQRTRRTGYTYAMFKAWLTHIQTNADRVVIVAINANHAHDLKKTEMEVLGRLREEFELRTKPNFLRSCLIKLGFAEREEYPEIGELRIITFNKAAEYVWSSKSIVVLDNGVYLNLHTRL